MKCVTCGGEISFSDKVCPHCGRALTETDGYRADVGHYENESAKTKKKVRQIIAENIPMVVSTLILLIFVIADGILIYVGDNAYSFREDSARRESVREYETYSGKIGGFLGDGDYTAFYAFMKYHNIAEWKEPYDDLKLVTEMAEKYSDIVSAVESATMFGPDARRYDRQFDINECQRAIWYFNLEYDRILPEIDADPYGEYIRDMKAKADTIMEVYLGLDEAGREKYFASSDIQQQAYLEEVLPHD